MIILATDILTLLSKAERLGTTYHIKQQDKGFKIQIYYIWDKEEGYSHRSVFITNENENVRWPGNYLFDDMMGSLDKMLYEQKQKEIKEQKRQELLARLTDEEKELLNLK